MYDSHALIFQHRYETDAHGGWLAGLPAYLPVCRSLALRACLTGLFGSADKLLTNLLLEMNENIYIIYRYVGYTHTMPDDPYVVRGQYSRIAGQNAEDDRVEQNEYDHKDGGGLR